MYDKTPPDKELQGGEGLFLFMASQVSVFVHLVLFGSMVAECIMGGANDRGGTHLMATGKWTETGRGLGCNVSLTGTPSVF